MARLGLTSSLEYFPTLGIDALWITPIFASPMADFGYDISDYRWVVQPTKVILDKSNLTMAGTIVEINCFRAINPIFGTMEDFDLMISEAKR